MMIIFVSMLSVSTPTGWDVFWPAAAAIGGIIVFFGLWIEKSADKKEYSNISDFRSSKAKGKCGWWILMIGISVEVLVGGALAYKDQREMNRAAADIAKNNPVNLQVSDIFLSMTVNVAGKRDGIPLEMEQLESSVELLETNITMRSLYFGNFQILTGGNALSFDHLEAGTNNNYHGYTMEFRPNRLGPTGGSGYVITDRSPLTPKHILDRIKALRFHLVFVPNDSEVISGSAEMVINGTFHKTFEILRQKTDKEMSGWNPDVKGFFLYATNSAPP
jgi:hypothetical protein